MAERRTLQARCRELKAYLPPGAKCTASNEQLRAWVSQAELRVLPAPVRPAARRGVLELVNDLIEVIAAYTIPFATYDLLTLDQNLASRLAYGELWKRKTIVERRGLVFNGEVLAKFGPGYTGWHTYYRLVAKGSFGTAAILFKDGSVVDLADRTTNIHRVGALAIARSGTETIAQTIKKNKTVTSGTLIVDRPTLNQVISFRMRGRGENRYLMINNRYRLIANKNFISPQLEEAIDLSSARVLFRNGDVAFLDESGVGRSVSRQKYALVSGDRIYTAAGVPDLLSYGYNPPGEVVVSEFFRGGAFYYILLDGSILVRQRDGNVIREVPPLPAVGVGSGTKSEVNVLLVDGTIHTYDLKHQLRPSRKYATPRPIQTLVGISDLAAIIY